MAPFPVFKPAQLEIEQMGSTPGKNTPDRREDIIKHLNIEPFDKTEKEDA